MPDIPVDPDSLPTSYAVMDETMVYTGFIHEANLAEDKNGKPYLAVNIEVTQPEEWVGKRVNDNYLPIPGAVTPQMKAGERRQVEERGVRFARFCKAFNPPRPVNTETMLGATGKFTIRNEEFPEGSGEMRPRVSGYVY